MTHIIGNEEIHDNQNRLARRVMKILVNNENKTSKYKKVPVVVMPPQSGKTGAMIALIYLFIQHCIEKGRTFQVVVHIGLPHTDLRLQTRERLFYAAKRGVLSGAQLGVMACNAKNSKGESLVRYPDAPPGASKEDRVMYQEFQNDGIAIISNVDKIKRLNLDADVDVRLILNDEGHIGNVKAGRLDTLLHKLGVDQAKSLKHWNRSSGTINHYVSVSATPGSQLLRDNVYVPCYEPPAPSYVGIKQLRDAGRLRPTTKNIVTSGFFLDRYQDTFLPACDEQGSGYLVVRARGKVHTALLALLRREKIKEVEQFDASPGAQGIDELISCLGTKPKVPTVVIIRGAMRAGMTLPKVNYIRAWIENEATHADTQAQSGVGRACGHNKQHEVYPIFCDTTKAAEWCEVYDALDLLYTERAASGDMGEVVGSTQLLPIPSSSKNFKVPQVLTGVGRKWRIAMSENGYDDVIRARIKAAFPGSLQIQTSSNNLVNDIAGFFLKGCPRKEWAVFGYKPGVIQGVHLDKATTKEALNLYIAAHPDKAKEAREWHARNLKSWKLLAQDYPEHRGQTYVFKEVKGGLTQTAKEVAQAGNSLTKPKAGTYDTSFSTDDLN